MSIDQLLIIIAFISFLLATIGISAKINLVALGLALLTLTLLI